MPAPAGVRMSWMSRPVSRPPEIVLPMVCVMTSPLLNCTVPVCHVPVPQCAAVRMYVPAPLLPVTPNPDEQALPAPCRTISAPP